MKVASWWYEENLLSAFIVRPIDSVLDLVVWAHAGAEGLVVRDGAISDRMDPQAAHAGLKHGVAVHERPDRGHCITEETS